MKKIIKYCGQCMKILTALGSPLNYTLPTTFYYILSFVSATTTVNQKCITQELRDLNLSEYINISDSIQFENQQGHS